MLISGLATELVRPNVYNGDADIYKIVVTNVQAWILLLGISAIQFWLSMRFRNFIPPLGIGLALWFLGPMMVFEYKPAFMHYYPYAFTILGVWPEYRAEVVTYQWYSVLTMVVFLVIGFVEFKTRRLKGA
jgi:hypothetical protein